MRGALQGYQAWWTLWSNQDRCHLAGKNGVRSSTPCWLKVGQSTHIRRQRVRCRNSQRLNLRATGSLTASHVRSADIIAVIHQGREEFKEAATNMQEAGCPTRVETTSIQGILIAQNVMNSIHPPLTRRAPDPTTDESNNPVLFSRTESKGLSYRFAVGCDCDCGGAWWSAVDVPAKLTACMLDLSTVPWRVRSSLFRPLLMGGPSSTSRM